MVVFRKRRVLIPLCLFVFGISLNSLILAIRRQHFLRELLKTQTATTLKSNISNKSVYHFKITTFWHHSISNKQRAKLPQRKSSSITNETLSILASTTVVFMACCRQAYSFLPIFRQRLQSIVTVFADYYILIGESDSSDDTLSYIQNWSSKDPHVYVQSYNQLDRIFTRRTVRIAFCRNSLLNIARFRKWIDKAHFLIVLDVDINSNEVLSKDTFLSNFEYSIDDWAAMTASQVVSKEKESRINRYRMNPRGVYDNLKIGCFLFILIF
jgi:hypothetical protein